MGKDTFERDRGSSAREDELVGHLLVLLLVPDQGCADRLSRALSDRVASENLRLEVVSQQAADAMSQARRNFGGIPLGFVAKDEVEALDALTQGADEVLIWPPRDDASLQGFFDRVKLRATVRRGQERLSASVAHTEKLTALGTLVAGVAHEINNPLTVLQFGVEACSLMLKEQLQTGARRHEAKQLLDEMLTAASSIANIVRDLRVFARSDSDREEPRLLDANDVLDQALRMVGRQLSTLARVERDYARDLPQVLAPHGRLTQVLINVLVNAAHAIDEVERPVHRLRIMTRTDGESVAVSISDTGPGIPPHALDHIFDPFFTTKRAGYGTGLGLSISRSIMHELGGDMIVESVHGSGATFILLLPIPDKASVRSAYLRNSDGPPLPTTPGLRRTVLLVDDDERVLSAYARALERSFDVLLAADGREAIDLLRSGSSADVLVSELALPQLDGQELYDWLQRERPALARRTIFVSAEATLQRYQSFVTKVDARVLPKPVTSSVLLTALNDSLASFAQSLALKIS